MKNMKQAMSTKLEDIWFGKKQIVDPRFLTDDKYHQDHTTIFTSLALNKNCGPSLRIWCYNSDEPSHRWLYPIKKTNRAMEAGNRRYKQLETQDHDCHGNPFARPFTAVSQVRTWCC
jgi:hypothetical protein